MRPVISFRQSSTKISQWHRWALFVSYLVSASFILPGHAQAKDLVDLSQDYRLAIGMESGCAKLEKLEQLDQELAEFRREFCNRDCSAAGIGSDSYRAQSKRIKGFNTEALRGTVAYRT